MTSEEIKATIKRLDALVRDRDNMPLVHDVADAFVGSDGYGLRNMLIDLLRQADPDTHMELPRDADGMPIHIGEEMEGADVITNGQRGTVHGFVRNAKGEYEWISDHQVRHKCKWWRRYSKPTVEDVLREFGDEVRMCCDTEDTIAEYATKLREMMQDD